MLFKAPYGELWPKVVRTRGIRAFHDYRGVRAILRAARLRFDVGAFDVDFFCGLSGRRLGW